MTKKDYELIAKSVRLTRSWVQSKYAIDDPEYKQANSIIDRVVMFLADELWITNPRFNGDKFVYACK